MTYQNSWDAANVVLRGELLALNASISKEKKDLHRGSSWKPVPHKPIWLTLNN